MLAPAKSEGATPTITNERRDKVAHESNSGHSRTLARLANQCRVVNPLSDLQSTVLLTDSEGCKVPRVHLHQSSAGQRLRTISRRRLDLCQGTLG